jgi:xanthine dehydrogenase molybdenum-binding subunit
VTLEGIDQTERDKYSQAFAACGGLQCGFCIPGIVVRAKAQVDKKGSSLKREDMARHLGAHLCRCTGYVKILDAIEMVAQDVTPVLVKTGGVGSRSVKYEAEALALGDRGYVDDIRVDGMLHAALHFTAHTRANVISIDVETARKASGVIAIYTAADIPGELMVGIIYKDWPVMIPVGGRTSYAGDVLAIVVADTRQHAREAARLPWQVPTQPFGKPRRTRSVKADINAATSMPTLQPLRTLLRKLSQRSASNMLFLSRRAPLQFHR